jgi:hypothetical protein
MMNKRNGIVEVYSKVLSHHLPGATEESHKKPESE